MDTLKYVVLGGVYYFSLLAGWSSPKQENNVFLRVGNFLYDSISKRFPTLARVAESHVFPYRQAGVEKKNPLLCPSAQRAVVHVFPLSVFYDGWHRADVLLYLLEDIYE